ncbi:MAG: glycoside hydrolase family 99-like domain-containing protein [Oligosphaeraceae bacterium]
MEFQKQDVDVAAYVWPAYTGDELRTRIFWPEGIGEWQSVKNAVTKYPGHSWPRKPVWGYVNEADPRVMEMEINAAADHGVNVFIYDWYWFDRRPFLEGCLNDGFLKASNRDRMKFYLMWANHNANYTWDTRNSDTVGYDSIIWRGDWDRKEFEVVAKRLVEKYFHLPNYYTIDGKPVFMIYDLNNLIRGLGGVEATKSALAFLREEAVRSGLPGLHLQAVVLRVLKVNVTGVDTTGECPPPELVGDLGFDSVTDYQFAHFVDMRQDYLQILEDVRKEWKRLDDQGKLPYIPHISIGWDNNPRFQRASDYCCWNNTPENFQKGLEMAREYLESHPGLPRLVTVNSWNEWTETSYLQPDDKYGYGYLEAVKRVFGN